MNKKRKNLNLRMRSRSACSCFIFIWQRLKCKKVFYCSRTHSQLGQFINELRRVRIPPALSTNVEPSSVDQAGVHNQVEEEFKHLTLGSRKNLCINPKVSKLGSATAINERCLDLQQPGMLITVVIMRQRVDLICYHRHDQGIQMSISTNKGERGTCQ